MPASLLPEEWSVPQKFRDRLGDEAGRQRCMEHESHLLLVLHKLPSAEDLTRVPRLVWRDAEGNWTSDFDADGLKGLDQHLSEYEQRLGELDEAEAVARTSADYFALLSELTPLVRAARHLHDTLQHARETMPLERGLINARDRAYRISRSAELLITDARNGLEYADVRQAEEQTRMSFQMATSAHRLNMLAAFFFPLATLSTVFGVNMQHGLEQLEPPMPFLITLGIGLLCGAFLALSVAIGPRKRQDS